TSHGDAPITVAVWADDRPVGLGDEAVAGAGDEAGDDATAAGTQDQAAPPDPAGVAGRVPGRVVELAAAPGASRVITVALDRAETTRVRAHHLIGGRP